MKGKITDWTKKEVRGEIIVRMNSLDVSHEEYSNKDLLSDFENLIKHNKFTKGEDLDKRFKKDVDAIMPTKEYYLKFLRGLYHKIGWTISAERNRVSYNNLCNNNKNKISKKDVRELYLDMTKIINVKFKSLIQKIKLYREMKIKNI